MILSAVDVSREEIVVLFSGGGLQLGPNIVVHEEMRVVLGYIARA